MPFLTEKEIREYRRPFGRSFGNILNEERGAELTVFLSHSHHDRHLVEGLIALLDGLDVKIYVDWNDNAMPRVTNRETAEKIKEQIKRKMLFMILATDRALNSKWVPWEVGIGDQVKGEDFILLIPVADLSGKFPGNEYLQLYNHLTFERPGLDIMRSRFRILSRKENDTGSFTDFLRGIKQKRQLFS
jgi:hypothetical protein